MRLRIALTVPAPGHSLRGNKEFGSYRRFLRRARRWGLQVCGGDRLVFGADEQISTSFTSLTLLDGLGRCRYGASLRILGFISRSVTTSLPYS